MPTAVVDPVGLIELIRGSAARSVPSRLKNTSAAFANSLKDELSGWFARLWRTSRGISAKKCAFFTSSIVMSSICSSMRAAKSMGVLPFLLTPFMADWTFCSLVLPYLSRRKSRKLLYFSSVAAPLKNSFTVGCMSTDITASK